MIVENLVIPCVVNDGEGSSYFSRTEIELSGDESRQLSEQIKAENFRLRGSGSNYRSDFHVAGDPTLLIILSGQIRLTLRSGEFLDFGAGDMFIAKDYLAQGVEYCDKTHGHMAEVTGEQGLKALHLKLEKRT